MFSIGEIIDLAIQIERNGERVYRNALRHVSNQSLTSLLQWLADEEAEHAKWFSGLKPVLAETPVGKELEEMGRAMLEKALGEHSFSLQETDFSTTDEADDLIKRAIEFQKDTVLFYHMLHSFIDNEETLDKLKKIIHEEERHAQVLEELLRSGAVKREQSNPT
jgi:rubrerythrin